MPTVHDTTDRTRELPRRYPGPVSPPAVLAAEVRRYRAEVEAAS